MREAIEQNLDVSPTKLARKLAIDYNTLRIWHPDLIEEVRARWNLTRKKNAQTRWNLFVDFVERRIQQCHLSGLKLTQRNIDQGMPPWTFRNRENREYLHRRFREISNGGN